MCEYFVKADPIQYEQRSRTVRIHGVLTSIRLENLVWDTLAEMAEEERCTTNALIVQFHDDFFFNDTATTEIYTVSNALSLHDALPICAFDSVFIFIKSVTKISVMYLVSPLAS